MSDIETSESSHLGGQSASASAFGWIAIAYCVALAVAIGVLSQDIVAIGDSVLERALVADVVATLVIFGFSIAFANASFYDAYWSVAPPALLAYFLFAQRADAEIVLETRAILLSTLVFAWAIRLTHNWARGWQGLSHSDWRYVDLAAKTAPFWWLVNLLGIHLFPTILVFVGCIAIHDSLGLNTRGLNSLDLLATAIGWGALWIEYTADNQLRDFRLKLKNQGKTLGSGVWAWCRHPNYLGEIGFWVALFVYAWAAVGSEAFAAAIWGPIVMLALFIGVSIPMIDKRLADREGFTEHKARTFALLPLSTLFKRQ